MGQAANDNQILISINDVCNMTSLSRTAISKHRSTGNFPVEVTLGERRIGFVKAEVLVWIEDRVQARRAA